MANVTTSAETNAIKAAQMAKVREVDFVEQFGGNILPKLMEALGVTRKIPMMEGTTMYVYKTTGTLQSGAVPEGEIINVSLHVVTVVRGAVLSKIPIHAAVDDGVFHVFDNPVESAVGLALAEADDAFGCNGDGIEGPLVRINVVHAQVRAFRVCFAADIELDS